MKIIHYIVTAILLILLIIMNIYYKKEIDVLYSITHLNSKGGLHTTLSVIEMDSRLTKLENASKRLGGI